MLCKTGKQESQPVAFEDLAQKRAGLWATRDAASRPRMVTVGEFVAPRGFHDAVTYLIG
jgi:hypothetical protein